MKRVSGYLANDGTYFDEAADCEYYESRKDLVYQVEMSIYSGAAVYGETFAEAALVLAKPLQRFLLANAECEVIAAKRAILDEEPQAYPSVITVVTSDPPPEKFSTSTGKENDSHSEQTTP